MKHDATINAAAQRVLDERSNGTAETVRAAEDVLVLELLARRRYEAGDALRLAVSAAEVLRVFALDSELEARLRGLAAPAPEAEVDELERLRRDLLQTLLFSPEAP